MKNLIEIIKLARPRVLVAGMLIYLYGALGSVVYGAEFSFWRIFFGYLVFLPAHLSVHYSNDYHDYEADAKANPPTLFTGGTGVLVTNPWLLPLSRLLALIFIMISVLLSVLFPVIYNFSWYFVAYVAACNLLGWYYAAPPVRLSYRGYSELSTSILIGFLIPGMGWTVSMGRLTPEFFLISIPMLIYGVIFITSVEIPDMEGDIVGGKNNLIARKGRRFGFIFSGVLSIAASMYFLGFSFESAGFHEILTRFEKTDFLPVNFSVLGAFTIPSFIAGISGLVGRPEERDKATSKVNLTLTSFLIFVLAADIYFALLIHS